MFIDYDIVATLFACSIKYDTDYIFFILNLINSGLCYTAVVVTARYAKIYFHKYFSIKYNVDKIIHNNILW